MPQFISHLASTRRDAELVLDRCRKAAGAGGGIVSGGAISQLDSQSRRRTSDSREQQTHYRGQPFISIRPIANRIAGQPIRLALVGAKPKGKASRFTETRQYQIPDWAARWTKGYGRNEGELTVIDQHPILDALHDPIPDIPNSNDWCLKYFTVANLELTGYAYLWMPKIKGRVQLWYLPSSWVWPIISEKNIFSGWNIRVEGATEPKEVPLDEIAPFTYPDPSSPFRAMGPMEAGAREIIVNEYVVDAQKRAFQLGIHPGAIITIGSAALRDGKSIRPRLKQAQLEQIVQAIKNRYAGMTHVGEPFILDRLIENVIPYGNKPNEMDFGMNADKSRERVEQVFGTNPYIVGAAGMGSRAESAVADSHFCHSTVNPKIELISRVLTGCVVPRFDTSGRYVLFIEPARPNDPEMEMKEWELSAKNCGHTINDWRTGVLRLPPVPWGDAVVVPNGYSVVPVDQLAEGYVVTRTSGPQSADVDPAAPPTPPKPEAGNEPPEEQDEHQAEGDEAEKSRRAFSKAFDDAFYDQYTETWLKAHDKQETSMAAAVEAFLKEQGEDVASKLESAWGDKGAELRYKASAAQLLNSSFEPDDWVEKFKDTVKPAFVYAVVAGATHELAAFGDYETVPLPDDAPASAKSKRRARKDIGFDINFEFGVDLPADVLEGINNAVDEALSKDYWAEIQQTTKDDLEHALKTGLEEGDSPRDMAKRIKDDVFGGTVGKDRAKRIARTEVTAALNSGQAEARLYLHEQGVVQGKEWFATFDGRTRHTHLTANGQQKQVNELFDVGGFTARFPGDPNLPARERCNCRCIASSVTVFTKRARNPQVKAILCRGCEVHGR